jgi:secreted PhoX family phosphatase
MSSAIDRRTFLRRGASTAGAGILSAGAMERLVARQAKARSAPSSGRAEEGYGPLRPAADQDGREILALPAGFSYVTFGAIGDRMSDGRRTPLALDGMAAFAGPNGCVRLIRNHEDRNAPGEGSVVAERSQQYDPQAGGGTTTLDYDPRTRTLVRDFVSLAGTIVNCAGGIQFRERGWITCEESIAGPESASDSSRFPRRHGYCYTVALGREGVKYARPVRAMGRFSHEAIAVDQRTGIVYLTEDPGSGVGAGLYRYIPNVPGNVRAGGRLQMLGIRRRPQVDLREGQVVGAAMQVEWHDIDDPDPGYEIIDDPRSVFNQGFGRGAAKFNRLEGCWYDDGSIFFVSTSGGDAKNGDVNSDGFREGFGQVWEYRSRARNPGLLTLIYESPSGGTLDSPDNLTVTPRGGLLLCEDDASGDGDTHPLAPGIEDVNRLIGLSPEGDPFEFAVNRLSSSEFAGACFSPDGETLFVNVFGDSSGTIEEHAGTGMTCAITGPWDQGPL